MTSRTHSVITVAVAATCLGVAALVASGPHQSAASWVILAALVAGPGWALTPLRLRGEPAYHLMMVLAMGISVILGSATLMVEIHYWRPVGAVEVVLVAASALSLARWYWGRTSSGSAG